MGGGVVVRDCPLTLRPTTLCSGLMSEVHGLEASNAQLRQLLAQYMTDPANSELHVPPAATVRIDPASLATLSASASTRRPPPSSGAGMGASAVARTPLASSSRRFAGGGAGIPDAAALSQSSAILGPVQSLSGGPGMLTVTSSPPPVGARRYQ